MCADVYSNLKRYVARIVAAPMIFAGRGLLLSLLGVPLVTGALLTFVFVLSHNFTGSEREPARRGVATDFWKLQVKRKWS